ncbi:unnamed protein product [Cladocopium goreaui]|uniref:Tyrosine specific protein phosphatases domain-containing protein n=1 Tax=Cladocopium goreaui TaxID=2562237 RepID=A0A9P1BSR2_9DINO|nr:unnamed protein product [Cladocopium goreaui]
MGDPGDGVPNHLWRVIGENGLLVRQEADLKSSELGRLPYGAVLLQKELRGERLGFQLLRGAGPLEGYVSLRIKGKELLQKCLVPLDPPETHVPNVSMEVEMPTHCLTSLLDFQRVANFRDLAEGLGARVALRPGKLFRTGHFAAALREDLGRLDALGIRTCVDLRDGLDFEGADAPVYDIFPPRPRSPRSVPSAEPGTRRRLWCPFSKDLKLRSWSSEEKLGLVPQHHRRAWHSWWYRGDGQAAEPAGNVGEGYQRYVRLFMEKKVEVNQASNLCALNRAILLVNSDEVLKAMKALSEVPWQRGLGSKDQNKCTRLYWLRAQGRFLLANAKEKNYPVAFGCVAGKDRTGLLACLVLSALGVDKETIMADYLKTNLAAEHINACVQVGMALWWKQLESEDPRRFKMLQRNGQVYPLDYDASWPGLKGGRASPGSAGNTAPVAPAVFPATMAYTLQLLEEEAGNGRSMCIARECHRYLCDSIFILCIYLYSNNNSSNST